MYFEQWTRKLAGCFHQLGCRVNNCDSTKEAAFDHAKKIILDARSGGKKIVIVGNGGSSAIASHISQDIINKLKIASLVITDASLITCISNDFGYENIFSKPLDILMSESDVLVAISDSGESKNVLNAVKIAQEKKCKIITLSAFKITNMLFSSQTDLGFHVPTMNYGMAEVSHLTILHTWIDELAGTDV